MAERAKNKRSNPPAVRPEPATVVPVPETAAQVSVPKPAARKKKLHPFEEVYLPVIWRALVIAIVSFVVFWPSVDGRWLWDDDFYITGNPVLNDPNGLWKIWFLPGSVVNYFPITATLAWLEWNAFGDDTFGYHVINILLHILSSLMVWRLFAKLGLRHGWIGGLLFAVHPTAVESVSWIAEMKNTLSLPPFIMAACAYIDYDRSRARRDYVLCFAWFIVAMLCKVTMVAFPMVMLLYAWWRHGRVTVRDFLGAAPFFAVSIGLGILNILVLNWIQAYHGIYEVVPLGGPVDRILRAGITLSFYFAQVFLPLDLSPMYPRWVIDPASPVQYLPWIVMAGLFAFLWSKRATWGRHVILGLGFFLLNLAPFAGVLGNSFMRFAWVMDHFLYLPIIGIIGLVLAAGGDLYERLPRVGRWLAGVGVAGLVALSSFQAWTYAAVYDGPITLWTYTTQRHPEAWMGWSNLGDAQSRQQNWKAALDSFLCSVALNPGFDTSHYNLALTYARLGRIDDAIAEYKATLAINPRHAYSYLNLGNIYLERGNRTEAEKAFRQAMKSDPHDARAFNNLANMLRQEKRLPEALDLYRIALTIEPTYLDSQVNYTLALSDVGRNVEAEALCRQVLARAPSHATGHLVLAVILSRQGRNAEALSELQTAAELDPGNPEIRSNMAKLQVLLNPPAPAPPARKH